MHMIGSSFVVQRTDDLKDSFGGDGEARLVITSVSERNMSSVDVVSVGVRYIRHVIVHVQN